MSLHDIEIPTYEQIRDGVLKLIDEGKISREDAAHVLPELRESEDERIRKIIRLALIASEDELSAFYSTHNITRKECTDWLEKQKENPKTVDSIPSFCISDAKWADTIITRAIVALSDDVDYNRDEPCKYRREIDDLKKLRDVLCGQKEQKPIYNLEIPAGDVAPAEEDGPFDEDEFLEDELSAFLQNYDKEYDDDAAVYDVARHFYEIGKKQKEHKPTECGGTNDESEYDKGYREGHRFGLKQTQEYMLSGGKTFSGLIPCWVNAPSELQPAHKYHGKNVVIMHENNGGFRCVCIDDKKPVTFRLSEDTLFVEGWRKKPAEWSEEDEKHRESILKRLDGMCKHGATFTQTRFAVSEDMDWLKSLRPCGSSEKPNNQAEWSEEDEKMLNRIIETLSLPPIYDTKACAKMVAWLKSLRPQPHWKPTEEQMKALKYVAYHLMPDDNYRTEMFSLYDGLKKL